MVPDYQSKWPDVEVSHLIISTDDYIVCLDKDLDVDWKTSDKYDEEGHEDDVQFHNILNNVALLESSPQHHLNNVNKKSFRRMLGESVARALANDYKNAESILEKAQNFLVNRSREKSRMWYLTTSATFTLVMIAVAVAFFLYVIKFKLDSGISIYDLVFSFVGGTVGAFTSITLRLGQSNVEADAGACLHVLESISRTATGGIGGILSGILIKLGVIMPAFNSPELLSLTLFAVGIAAGASERFIPSFISKIEKEEN